MIEIVNTTTYKDFTMILSQISEFKNMFNFSNISFAPKSPLLDIPVYSSFQLTDFLSGLAVMGGITLVLFALATIADKYSAKNKQKV